MKTLVGVIAFVVMSMVTFAQMENIPISADSTLMLDKAYAGVLSGSLFSTDSLYASTFANMRVGAMATYQPKKWVAIKAWAIYQAEKDSGWHIQQFWCKLTPIKGLSIEMGNMATLVTEQRPHPVSGDGQFETFSEAQIAGMALNTKIKYEISPDIKAGTGIALRKDKPEYSGMLSYKKAKLSGWYSQWNEKIGAALILTFDRVYSTSVWRQDQMIAQFLAVQLDKNKTIAVYADNGYDLMQKKLVRGEWGLMKTFESGHKMAKIKGLFGLGYCHETKSIHGYLFVHI